MKIGIVLDKNKPKAVEGALRAEFWLKERGHRTYRVFGDRILRQLDFIMTFGGDGLVLHTANKIKEYDIPMIRVNYGYVGALTNIEPSEIEAKLSQIFEAGNYIITKRNRIQVSVWNDSDDIVMKGDALNDIVIERTITRGIAIEVVVEGIRRQYRGDGFVFATRTGSSAYAESSGGPTLIKDNKFILRVVSSSNRELLPYLIASSDVLFQVIEIQGQARLVIDGRKAMNLKNGLEIRIKKSEKPTLFVEIGDVPKKKR